MGNDLRDVLLLEPSSSSDSLSWVRSPTYTVTGSDVIFGFLPRCPACMSTRDTWSDLAVQHPTIRFRALTPTGGQEHVRLASRFFPTGLIPITFADLRGEVAALGHLVPITLLMQNGVVQSAYIGILTPDRVDAISRTLRTLEEMKPQVTSQGA